jgi:hypothetical protein
MESFHILTEEVYSNCVLSVWWLQVVETKYPNQELAELYFTYRLADGNVPKKVSRTKMSR